MVKKKKIQSNISATKPPVVAVLGHVDHGKTTLLDTLRKSRIVSGEYGNITQHIGAYQVKVGNEYITFIDTPGHEAFTNLRARGARIADIALLIIDSAESVKDQTIESIKIIKKAGIPFIVVLNKIDLPKAMPEKVVKNLLRYDVMVESLGGKIASVKISAKTGKGIDDLLDTILLVAQMKKLTISVEGSFKGVVIEASKNIGRGNVATVLVQQGIVSVGDAVVIANDSFRIRALINDRGKSVRSAGAGMPVEILGFSSIPAVGGQLVESGSVKSKTLVSNDNISVRKIKDAVLRIFLKADTKGSLEAIIEGLPKSVSVVSSGIGEVIEKDISFAKTAGLVVLGFNIRVSAHIKNLAKEEGVQMRTYTIIYKLFEEIADVVVALEQGPQKNILGKAKILQEFMYQNERVAGSQVTEGRIARGDTAVILRGEDEIDETVKIVSIKQQKDDVTKVEKGSLCGIRFSREIDFQVGDVIQSFTIRDI